MTRLTGTTALLLLAACGTDATMTIDTIETTRFAAALGVDIAASTRNDQGLHWRDLAPGSGPTVSAGQTVEVSYEGWLADGTRFDGTTAGDPFSFRVGVGEVISGWDQGVTGMRVGGKRQLIIPPALGYGSRGAGGVIPPNAILVFTVEVHTVR